jgi:hypothetical protein
MASKLDKESAAFCRDDLDVRASILGHTMTWALGANSNRGGYYYHFVGRCEDCGAMATAGWAGSSCPSVRDARRVPCSGPGTAILTEIEERRSADLIAGAVAAFGQAVAQGGTDA